MVAGNMRRVMAPTPAWMRLFVDLGSSCSCGSQIKLGVIAFIFPDAMGAIGQERRLHVTNINDGTIAVFTPTGTGALLRMMLLNRDTSTCRRSGLFVGDDDDTNMVVGSILLSRCLLRCSYFGMLDCIIRIERTGIPIRYCDIAYYYSMTALPPHHATARVCSLDAAFISWS
jgi:hypothetical protein